MSLWDKRIRGGDRNAKCLLFVCLRFLSTWTSEIGLLLLVLHKCWRKDREFKSISTDWTCFQSISLWYIHFIRISLYQNYNYWISQLETRVRILVTLLFLWVLEHLPFCMKLCSSQISSFDINTAIAEEKTPQELWHKVAKFMFSKDMKSINQILLCDQFSIFSQCNGQR